MLLWIKNDFNKTTIVGQLVKRWLESSIRIHKQENIISHQSPSLKLLLRHRHIDIMLCDAQVFEDHQTRSATSSSSPSSSTSSMCRCLRTTKTRSTTSLPLPTKSLRSLRSSVGRYCKEYKWHQKRNRESWINKQTKKQSPGIFHSWGAV